MFTVEQIEEAHSKVKSGTDFPNYIQEIKNLGVKHSKLGYEIVTPNISVKMNLRPFQNPRMRT